MREVEQPAGMRVSTVILLWCLEIFDVLELQNLQIQGLKHWQNKAKTRSTHRHQRGRMGTKPKPDFYYSGRPASWPVDVPGHALENHH